MALSQGLLPLGVETCCNDPEHPCPPKKPIPSFTVAPKLPPAAKVIPDFPAFVPAIPISFSGSLPAPCG